MMMMKMLVMVTMLILVHAEDDMKTSLIKLKEGFEELKSTVKDLSVENAELKAENFNLKKNNQMVTELKVKNEQSQKDFQELKAENFDLKKNIQKLENKMEAKGDELKKDFQELTVKNDQLECKATEIVRDVSFLKNPPHYHICVYQHFTSVRSSNVQFQKELYSDCNMCDGEEGNSPANFDLASGVYTNGWPGTYTVTWDLWAGDDHGEPWVEIYLQKNGVNIEESYHASVYTGSSGYVDDQGGRTMILRMESGDTLSLRCQDCSAHVYDITFCVSLNTFDVL